MKRSSLLLAAAGLLLVAGTALACPMCKEVVSNQTDPTLSARLTSGFAWSLGILLCIPYLLFSGITVLIVRSVRHSRKTAGQPTS